MKCWSVLIAAAVMFVLSACGNTPQAQGTEAVPLVPTSPNAAYQTTFPIVGATDVTILEGRLPGSEVEADEPGGGGPVESPTPDAAPVVTETVFEEETPSPETINPRDAALETATPSP